MASTEDDPALPNTAHLRHHHARNPRTELHVVQYSGGIGSWAAAQRVAARYGTDRLVLLFADVLIEDPDLYRWLDDSSARLGVPITRVADGRTPWQVFADARYLGNSRIAPCTTALKIAPCRRWLDTHADPATTTLHIGLDTSPRDRRRAPAIAAGWTPWHVHFPLLSPPHLSKDALLRWARQMGLSTPRLYDLGLPHNNCGGTCVRAGKHQWARVLDILPEHFAAAEAAEQQLRKQLGDVTILTEQIDRIRHRLTLTQLRERLAAGGSP